MDGGSDDESDDEAGIVIRARRVKEAPQAPGLNQAAPAFRSPNLRWVKIQEGLPGRPDGRTVLQGARIALCHDRTLRVRGSEKVAAALADILRPDAIFTLAARPDPVARVFPGEEVWAPRFGLRRGVHRQWASLLPLLPFAWRALALEEFDVVVTSSHSSVNAVRTARGVEVVSYCHTPARYAWAWRDEMGRVPAVLRPLWPLAAAVLRRLDRAAARNVGTFIANSRFIADRIKEAYGAASTVIHPPVDTAFFTPDNSGPRGEYVLVAGRHVAHKRSDIAVDAARLAGVPLVVAGGGPLFGDLRGRAIPGTRFVETPSDERLRELYRGARALLFPGVEDFGITPVEAMACGTPVVAFAAGGATETVIPNRSGVLVEQQTPEAFARAIAALPKTWDPVACRAVAEAFGTERFRERIVQTLKGLRGS